MKKVTVLVLLLLLPLIAGYVFAGEVTFAKGARCAQCGMRCDIDSPFISLIEEPGGSVRPFCDIGDLMIYVKEHNVEKSRGYRVRDFHSHQWIDAGKAFYVKNGKFQSPMGWNIAAFSLKEKAVAEGKVMIFFEAVKSLP